MVNNGSCPTREQLEAILESRDSLPAEILNHVESCEHCHRVLDQLSDPPELRVYRDAGRHLSQNQRRLRHEQLFVDLTGRFEAKARIGVGGMGVVFRGSDRELDRDVAIKLLSQIDSDVSLERFRREAKALSRLSHPNIVPVLTTGITDRGMPFLVMPMLEGQSLRERINEGTVDPRQAADWMHQIACGLAAAHRHGLIHRDVKPANIFLDSCNSLPKLLDFGLVRLQDDDPLTRTEVICGTPEYMSPEHAGQQETPDARSDVYSLGISLYECLTGTVPFRGRPLEILQQHRELEPVSPRKLNSAVPRDLETICLKAIRKEPSQRYATAEAFAADLQNFLEGCSIAARPEGPVGYLWRWSRRNRGLATAIFTLLLSLTSGTIITAVLWQQSEHNAKLAGERNAALETSYRVLRENQSTLRKSLQSSFFDTLRNRDAFVQLPTSVRNTSLISFLQTSQLLFDMSRDDSAALRELADDLSDAAEFALSFRMELRATELTHLGRQIVERLEEKDGRGPVDELLRAARMYQNYATARQELAGRIAGNDSLIELAYQAFVLAQRDSSDALRAADRESELVQEQAKVQWFQARCGLLRTDSQMTPELIQAGLVALYDESRQTPRNTALSSQWTALEERLLLDLANVSPPEKAVNYLQLRGELFTRSQRELRDRTGQVVDSWMIHTSARNQIMLGTSHAALGNQAEARQCFESAVAQFQGLTELFALAGHYRLGWYESLLLLARTDRESGSKESAARMFEKAKSQIAILVQMNPQDEGVCRRAAELHRELGQLCRQDSEHQQAAEEFTHGADYARQNSRNPYRLNPDDTVYAELMVDLLVEACTSFDAAGNEQLTASTIEMLASELKDKPELATYLWNNPAYQSLHSDLRWSALLPQKGVEAAAM